MADLLPILSKEEEEEAEDSPDTNRFRELPPPYSENEQVYAHSSKQETGIVERTEDLPELRVYTRRWYILALFCGMACHQCIVWNTWGPIESGAQFAFDWSESTVAMFANWGTILFLLSVIPLSKMIELDLRKTVLLVSGLMAAGTVLRCGRKYINNEEVFLISCHACAILNGISGVTVMAAPPLISSTWFPASERTTATAINQAANALGNGIAMFLGPALIHYKPANGTNTTQHHTYLAVSNFSNTTQSRDEVQANIDIYMDILAGVALLLFGLFVLYFPSKPPNPPALSSATQRTEFVAGIEAMLSNKDVLLACFAYSVPGGVMGAYMSVMVNQIRPLNYSDQEIGMMGLAAVLAQCIMSMTFGFITDRLKNKMKATLLLLLTVSTASFIWLAIMCLPSSPLEHSKVKLYLAIIIATSAAYSCCPLFFEMTVELAYPINEGTVAGFLTAMNNFVGMIFLFLFFVPSLIAGNCMWVSYSLVASTLLAIPTTALIKEHYNRSNVDESADNT